MLDFEFGTTFGIRIITQSTFTGIVTIRGATKSGPFVYKHTTDVALAATNSTFQLNDIPLWVTVVDTEGVYVSGQCYVRVQLVLNGDALHELAAGYVWRNRGLSYPPIDSEAQSMTKGINTTIAVGAPGAGNEFSSGVSLETQLRLQGLRFLLTASATVANRRVHLQFKRGGTVLYETFAAVDHTASQAMFYSCWPVPTAGAYNHDNDILIPIPDGLILGENDTVNTATVNLQAGDAFTGIILIGEQLFANPA